MALQIETDYNLADDQEQRLKQRDFDTENSCLHFLSAAIESFQTQLLYISQFLCLKPTF